MHVNPAVIRSNSGIYDANSAARAKNAVVEKAPVRADKSAEAAEKTTAATPKAAENDAFSFWDLVDIINPLQHIPVVNTIYREITGDKINSFGQIAGGAIFGGFIGAAIGGVNAIVKHDTGNDLTEMALVKAGFRAPATRQDDAINMVPVVEKRDAAVKTTAAERVTLDSIIWDAPSLLQQVAIKESITWDAPSIAVVTQQAAPIEANFAAKIPVEISDKVSDKIPAHVVRDVPKDAYQMASQMAATMPDPKSLNDIEPGNPVSPVPVGGDAAIVPQQPNVPNAMMQALAKYQSMQRLGGEQAVSAQELDQARLAGNASRKFSKLGTAIRRY